MLASIACLDDARSVPPAEKHPAREPGRAALGSLLGELNALLARNSMDAPGLAQRIAVSPEAGCYREDMDAILACLVKLDFRRARDIVQKMIAGLR